MGRILSHNVNAGHYIADACIVWCFDDRFSGILGEYVKNAGFAHYDLVKIAGGAKDISSPDNENSRHFVLDQIGKSVRLHAPKEVILMMHSGCGACGENTDADFYKSELNAAGDIVRKFLQSAPSNADVTLLFADFNGIQKI